MIRGKLCDIVRTKSFIVYFLVDAALFSGPKICWLKTPWLDVMSNFWGSDQFGYVSFIYLADQANALEINYTNLYDTQSI